MTDLSHIRCKGLADKVMSAEEAKELHAMETSGAARGGGRQ